MDSLGSKIEAITTNLGKIGDGLTKVDYKLWKAFTMRKHEIDLINISAKALVKT